MHHIPTMDDEIEFTPLDGTVNCEVTLALQGFPEL